MPSQRTVNRHERDEKIRAYAAEGRSVQWLAATFTLDDRTVGRIIRGLERGQGWANDEPDAEWELAPGAYTQLAELPSETNDWLSALEDFGPNDTGECVYFIQEVGTGFVKIGITNGRYPWLRLRSLQVGNPHQLAVRRIVKGGLSVESVIHAAFAARRVRGEWFDADERLGEIARLEA